jgi:hypothetical protein
MSELHISIHRPDGHTLQQVEAVARAPADDLAGLQGQVATLAGAVLQVSRACADITDALQKIARHAVFTRK